MNNMRKNRYSIIFFVIFFVFVIFNIMLVISRLSQKNSSFGIATRAEGDPNPEGSPAWCADHCNPSPETNPCNQSETYKFADCCREIASSGDPGACSWPDRGYCLDSHCASIPEGVSRERCGGPKHSWCDLCTKNHCPGYGAPVITPSPTPLPTRAPTPVLTKPVPTKPTASPTAVPVENTDKTCLFTPTPKQQQNTTGTSNTILRAPPNELPVPTVDTFPGSESDSNTGPLDMPSLSLPRISLPKIQINLPKINTAVKKPMDFFEYIFRTILTYDRKLEQGINKNIESIVK